MKPITYHIIAPAIAPAAFFLVATTPVEVLGCFMRGLMALLIALLSGLAALGTAMAGAKGRMRNDAKAAWWIASSMILTIPVIALILMA